MTFYEKTPLKLREGDRVTHYDDGEDGYPVKWVEGTVTGVSEEGFDVLWDDFKEQGWETEYEWTKVTIKGDQIIEDHNNSRQQARTSPVTYTKEQARLIWDSAVEWNVKRYSITESEAPDFEEVIKSISHPAPVIE